MGRLINETVQLKCEIRRNPPWGGERRVKVVFFAIDYEGRAPVEMFRTVDGKRIGIETPERGSVIKGTVEATVSNNMGSCLIQFPDGEYMLATKEELDELRGKPWVN